MRREGTGARFQSNCGLRRRKISPAPLHAHKEGLWALLALLTAALIAALALGLLDGSGKGVQSAGQGQGATGQQGTGSAQEGVGAGGTATEAGGSLTAGGTSMLPPPAGGLGDYVGQDATGKSVVVQSVVRNAQDNNTLEGFWVGGRAQDRVYVEWGGTVGSNEADYTPNVSEGVNLTVRCAPPRRTRQPRSSSTPRTPSCVRLDGGFVNADERRRAQD